MTTLNLKHVEYFVAAAEYGSMTVAAEKMFVSQPAVSLGIAELERALGTTLVIRVRGRGLSLTPAGTELLVRARNLVRYAESLEWTALGLDRELAGALTVGCFGTGAPLVLPALMETFERKHPQVTLSFVEGGTSVLEQALLSGECEIALMYDIGLHVKLERRPLYAAVPYALVAPEHPLAGRASVTLPELAAYDFIALDVEPVHEHQLDLFAHAGVSPRIRYPHLQLRAGALTGGARPRFTLLISRPYGDVSYEGRPLTVIPLTGDVMPVAVMLATAPGVRPTVRAQAFAAHCRELLPELSSFDKTPTSGALLELAGAGLLGRAVRAGVLGLGLGLG